MVMLSRYTRIAWRGFYFGYGYFNMESTLFSTYFIKYNKIEPRLNMGLITVRIIKKWYYTCNIGINIIPTKKIMSKFTLGFGTLLPWSVKILWRHNFSFCASCLWKYRLNINFERVAFAGFKYQNKYSNLISRKSAIY